MAYITSTPAFALIMRRLLEVYTTTTRDHQPDQYMALHWKRHESGEQLGCVLRRVTLSHATALPVVGVCVHAIEPLDDPDGG